jgi:hypothetical protein
VAHAARPPAGPGGLRGDPPLTPPSKPPFAVDEARLYDVSPAGQAWTGEDTSARAARQRRLRWLLALGLAANALTWTGAGLAFGLGGRLWGGGFGLLALLSLPLLALPALLEAAARHRARRRHRSRPPGFG